MQVGKVGCRVSNTLQSGKALSVCLFRQENPADMQHMVPNGFLSAEEAHADNTLPMKKNSKITRSGQHHTLARSAVE